MPGDEGESGVALVVLLFTLLLPADGDLGGVLLQRGFGPVVALGIIMFGGNQVIG